MKHIVVLGAGRVARPCVQYLLRQGFRVTVVDRSEENLRNAAAGHQNCSILREGVGKDPRALLEPLAPDLTICLLPPAFMAPVARACLVLRVPLVHPAYLDGETRALTEEIRAAGLVFLPEMGLDPGIDHMSASKAIRGFHARGGQVESFRSLCGALPSLEANTNPWGYKLSWAPASLIGASKRDARILEGGRVVSRLGGSTYEHPFLVEVEGLGWFEAYANADSLPYREAYGIPEVRDLYRGTLRYLGWSETICAMNALGLVEEAPQDLEGMSFRGFMARQVGAEGAADPEEAVRSFLKLPSYSAVMMRFRWLGLFDEARIPSGCRCARDVIARLFDERLVFAEGERDLVVLTDEYRVRLPEGRRIRALSTLVDFGIPGGDTSIARTTGLPPAIAARCILEGRIATPGLHLPTTEEIYTPILEELEREGVRLTEREQEI